MSKPYWLYLDDERSITQSYPLMCQRIGVLHASIYQNPRDWVVVKHYSAFCKEIEERGLPELISFDHDLSPGHYHKNLQEGKINYESEDFNKHYYKTGYHCAQFLVDYCIQHSLEIPEYLVHSMNPIGVENIHSLLKNAKKHIMSTLESQYKGFQEERKESKITFEEWKEFVLGKKLSGANLAIEYSKDRQKLILLIKSMYNNSSLKDEFTWEEFCAENKIEPS